MKHDVHQIQHYLMQLPEKNDEKTEDAFAKKIIAVQKQSPKNQYKKIYKNIAVIYCLTSLAVITHTGKTIKFFNNNS